MTFRLNAYPARPYHLPPSLRPRPTAPRPTAALREGWRDARLFQTRVQRALRQWRIPFGMWLVLETLYELLERTGDAVSQAQVAERAGMTKMVVSYWMTVLDREGFINREPDLDGRAYRVITTSFGDETLEMCNERLADLGLAGIPGSGAARVFVGDRIERG
jgi:DNA-binding MarR family transcriptional regulator